MHPTERFWLFKPVLRFVFDTFVPFEYGRFNSNRLQGCHTIWNFVFHDFLWKHAWGILQSGITTKEIPRPARALALSEAAEDAARLDVFDYPSQFFAIVPDTVTDFHDFSMISMTTFFSKAFP